jgi:hypothetical protein
LQIGSFEKIQLFLYYECSQVDAWDLAYSSWGDPLTAIGVDPWWLEAQQRLQAKASQWVAAATSTAAAQQQHARLPASRSASQLRASSVSSSFIPAAAAGLVLYEPFAGLCGGLEMVLHNGLPVHTYIYSNISPLARQVAQHRLDSLLARYQRRVHDPSALLPASALHHDLQCSARMSGLISSCPPMPRGMAGRKCAWVLVFRTAYIKHQLLTAVPADMSVRYALA